MNDGASIQAGIWEHRSGNRYLVLGVGRFDEDEDEVVVYVRLYVRAEGGTPLNVRRASEFLAPVEWPDGRVAPRFRLLGQKEPVEGGSL